MLVRRFCAALVTTVLAAGGVVLAAAPSYASNTCSAPTPFTGNTAGTVGPGDPNDYWSYSAGLPGTYKVTLTTTSGLARMTVYGNDCTTARCATSSAPCSFSITSPETVVIKVYNNSTTTTDAYTLAVEWTTQPRLGLACSDGVDNDGDGFADTADTGCTGPLDTSEGPATCPTTLGTEVCLSLTPGVEVARVPVALPGVGVTSVVATIDRYDFSTAMGTVSIPCVVMGDVNACAALGGTFAQRLATLGPLAVPSVDTVLQPVTTVGVCFATLTATVDGIGVEDVPAATIC